MDGKRTRYLAFDPLERRIAVNAGVAVPAAAHTPRPRSFVAHLTLVILDTPNDQAAGTVKIQFSPDGQEAAVSGGLSRISNVSSIVLRLPPTMSTTTTNGMTTTNTNDQTVAILLSPGAGSGPFRHVTFTVGINRFSLIGQLVGRPLSSLLKQVRQGNVSVVVQTNNGVDSGTTVAAGNMPSGEIQGTLLPATHKASTGQS